MIGLVASRADRASEHIAEQLLDLADWSSRVDDDRPDARGGGTYHRLHRAGDAVELRAFDDLHIYLDDPTAAFSERPDYLVFLSRHSGDTGPLLTCHFTGNFGDAEYGGASRAVAPACPGVQRALVAGFDAHAPDGYDVAIEGTHHGPTDLAVPAVFAELGSDDAQWDDPAGAAAVARAVLELPDRDAAVHVGDPADPRHLVGFGGGHYAPRFERVVGDTAWGVGHIAVDWQLDDLGNPKAHPDVVDAAFDASDARFALVEGDRPVLREALENRGYRVVSETWVRVVGDRPLGLVAALESDLCSVDDGLRFGARTDDVEGDGGADSDADRDSDSAADRSADSGDTADRYVVADLPDDLLAAAQGIDPDRTRDAVEAHTVAFETAESGTRAVGEAALADPADRAALVDALADVLREKYDDVERRGGAVVARVDAFDPALARDAGVPEGPKFGRLSSGEPVDVDGETVEPADVRSVREERFPA
ncbi:D-aminoacyl-tRNA deacylase [Halobaculum sp. D14]|uniref:D-aminoacyl-tRNA deacylase n=1 Tax=Halobaculum sp. D14 TaxID=3421642 RepID=UPI003EB8F40F